MSKTEGRFAGEYIVSEANGNRSREVVTIASGQGVLGAATVLARQLVGAAGEAAANAGNAGNGAMGAITVGVAAKRGVYKLTFIEPASDAGTFKVEDPDGVEIGTGTVAVAFSAGGLGFTLADGGNNFVAGDGFAITVSGGTEKHVAWDEDGVNGAEIAAAILYDGVDATSADVKATAHVRDMEFNKADLSWAGEPDAAEKAAAYAQLASKGMIGR